MGQGPVVDSHGRLVQIGTKVRVLSLPSGVIEAVEKEEADRVLLMVGEVFEVDEIDKHGCAPGSLSGGTSAPKEAMHTAARFRRKTWRSSDLRRPLCPAPSGVADSGGTGG